MRIEFSVKDRPPRKGGAMSMWGKGSGEEARLVASLRTEALIARKKAGLKDCFHSWVALELTVFVSESQLASVGDLDTFVAGVCDGLQAADRNVLPHLHPVFQDPSLKEIHPRYPLIINDDKNIISIMGRKVRTDEGGGIYYRVAVEEAPD